MDFARLATRLQEILDAGGGEPLGPGPSLPPRFLPLVTLDSGARCGLDRDAAWIFLPGDGRPAVRCPPATAGAPAPRPTTGAPAPEPPAAAHHFHEVLEWKRSRFDDSVEAAARAAALPVDEAVFSFPAVDVVRAVLAKQHAYMTRLALEWLRTTELRELRAEIVAVGRALDMPVAVKDLAERLTVPE
jgi:hypothetical protein